MYIYDATQRDWIPFKLWKEQFYTLKAFHDNNLIVVLKARQLGLSWLALAYILHGMLFHPAQTSLLFSRRDTESMALLDRMRDMYKRLPSYFKVKHFEADSGHEWRLSNGSAAMAFPTTAGDSYTASIVLMDEADLIPDLNQLMGAVKPTIDGGGKLIMVSRSDKSKPLSEFKAIYRGGKNGENDWTSIFLPWYTRPERDKEWYEKQKRDIFTRTQSLDALYEQYPSTDEEALAPRTLDKRIPPERVRQCTQIKQPIQTTTTPTNDNDLGIDINGLVVWALPKPNHTYVIGGDTAEGNPNSDESVWQVLDEQTGEQVAMLAGRFEPSVFGAQGQKISSYYNDAPILVEKNNHGHAVILWLQDNAPQVKLLSGDNETNAPSDLPKLREKPGWLSNSKTKSLLYDKLADDLAKKRVVMYDAETSVQVTSIENSTLRAPDNMYDDRSDAIALAVMGRHILAKRGEREKDSEWFFVPVVENTSIYNYH